MTAAALVTVESQAAQRARNRAKEGKGRRGGGANAELLNGQMRHRRAEEQQSSSI